MDGRKNNRGTIGNRGGRKKGTGLPAIVSGLVESRINEMVDVLFADPKVKEYVLNSKAKNPFFGGWLYLIKNKANGLFKIGITQYENPKQRLNAYINYKMDIDVIYLSKHDFVHDLEKQLHDLVPSFTDGCWFVCDMELLCDMLMHLSHQSLSKKRDRELA